MEIQPLSPEASPVRQKPNVPSLLLHLPTECTELIMTALGSDLGRFAAVCRSASEAAKSMEVWRDAYQARPSIPLVASASLAVVRSAWPYKQLFSLLPTRSMPSQPPLPLSKRR